jgi:hexosaminidase
MPFFRPTTSKLLQTTLVLLCIACNSKKTVVTEPAILPLPNEQIVHEGTFIWDDGVEIEAVNELQPAANLLQLFVGKNINAKASVSTKKVQLVIDETIQEDEGYVLEVSPQGIQLSSKNIKGAFLGVQTLRQLLPPCIEDASCGDVEIGVQAITVKDAPQYLYRGMHLDVGRHFFSVDFIKKYIDMLAMVKMNTFHWHLTEDQGWRIEIKKYPKLTTHAAYRNETIIGHNNTPPDEFDGKRYGGFYTQEEIKEVVAHATARGVTVIPEIELPGHSQAAISAYPELGCTGEQIEVATRWGVFNDIYCTKESTFAFLEDVLDEVVQIFPSTYIHIGGDEAPKKRWEACSNCQKRIKDEGLQDEHELQSYFISRIEKYLNSKGRQIIGWDEILEGGLAPNATVMSWRGTNGAVQAAKQGHDVILTPGSHCYFDHYQSKDEDEPLAIGGFTSLEKVYSFNPIPEELTADEAKYVLGAQGNVWTEYMKTSDKVEYMVFPRILALSEVVWSKPDSRDYDNFLQRVVKFNKRLDHIGVNYANHLNNVTAKASLKDNKLYYELSTTLAENDIRYTTDGSKPTATSAKYTSPIEIEKTTTLRAQVFKGENTLGKPYSTNLEIHKAVGADIKLNVPPHLSYSTGGNQALANGILGSKSRFKDPEWLGFSGQDVEVAIDLGKVDKINKIATRFFNAKGDWIHAPSSVEVSFSEDGKNYSHPQKTEAIPDNDRVVALQLDFNNVKARFIKFKVNRKGIIPKGFAGAGNEAWTFLDEIQVW